jgi:hypothetical protein
MSMFSQALVCFVPVNHVPECPNISGSVVLVVYMVRVFEYVENHENSERRIDVRVMLLCLHDASCVH